MFLKRLKIYNFRCFFKKEIEFNENINIFVGLNATGKTSVLEAINYLGLTKSFKTGDDNEVIRFGFNEMSVSGFIFKNSNFEKYKISKNVAGKKAFKNEYCFSKISDYLGEVLIVSFSNSDLNKLLGFSKDRRKIFEPIICQISKVYVREHNYYNKILNERNALLKRLMFEKNDKLLELLKVLNFQLIESAKQIIETRRKFVLEVNKKISFYHSQIASSNESVKIKYKPNVAIEEIEKKLESTFEQDLKKGTTTVGPHKDDFEFEVNGNNVVNYGSQGQQRNVLISLKLTFIEILKDIKNENPILLLDDVFSELDPIRQNNLFKVIGRGTQVFISTATLAEIDSKVIQNATIIKFEKEE